MIMVIIIPKPTTSDSWRDDEVNATMLVIPGKARGFVTNDDIVDDIVTGVELKILNNRFTFVYCVL